MLTPERAGELMREAISTARECPGDAAEINPKVGAVVADANGQIIAKAFRGETGAGEHAEFILLEKKVPDQDLSDAVLFVTLEPCTSRGPGKTPCAERIANRRIRTVYIGAQDANPDILGKGEFFLRQAGIQVERFPNELVCQINELNKGFNWVHRPAHLPQTSMYVQHQISDIMRAHLRKRKLDVDALPVAWHFTIDDVMNFCATAAGNAGLSKEETALLILKARAKAFDRQYSAYDYSNDIRGANEDWQNEITAILRKLAFDDYANHRVIDVGIGNGLEAQGLLDSVAQLTIVDIAKESLQKARSILPRADALQMDAENLEGVSTGSIDAYLSFRTYQSSYFGVTRALREAHRVVRPGGVVLLSVANGFLGEDGNIIRGLVVPRTQIVDEDKPFEIVERIRQKLTSWRFGDVGMQTGYGDVFVWGRRGR